MQVRQPQQHKSRMSKISKVMKVAKYYAIRMNLSYTSFASLHVAVVYFPNIGLPVSPTGAGSTLAKLSLSD